ncbi:MaoC/PaaZ C-terminal domain-containing protein [Nocardia salmonicida]|uniref:MaoC/PaaZ C-terminal domain-containing protein n=1 Tax=Nocardia salmonicida TaxID=53431 RepID=UPI0033C8F36D
MEHNDPSRTRDREELRFDPSGLDRWSKEGVFEVTRARLSEYAEATNDPIPAHRSGAIASPVFAIVPVFRSMLEPTFAVIPRELSGHGVHLAQDFTFHRPIRPGDTLTSRAKMVGYHGRPNGTSGHIVMESRSSDGELVNEQAVTVFVRGFDAGESIGEPAPDHRFPEHLLGREPLATVTQQVDDDQTFRYSPAAGDPMPIHLDDDFARQMGLPGVIVHGMCTLAFASWAVLGEVGGSDVGLLKRLAGRFASPVLPGQVLTTRIWAGEQSSGSRSYHFLTSTDTGVVIKDGFAELGG